jgi:hypothetical protein
MMIVWRQEKSMEFKVRYIKKQKAQKVKNRQEGGFVRIKVRGRKRWVKAKPAAEEKKEA